MTRPYTIQILVPNGDPEGLKIIGKMNWTGLGLIFPRHYWPVICNRPEFKNMSVYILGGFASEEDEINGMPTIYIGQTSTLFDRMTNHDQKKEFWDYAACFVSSSDSLMQSDVLWMEYKLVQLAKKCLRVRLENTQAPKEPNLPMFQQAGTQSFLDDVLQILPIMGINAFQEPKAVSLPSINDANTCKKITQNVLDTIIVPAQENGFKEVFIGENRWYSIRISGDKLNQIRYIAVYQVKPIMAITHYAKIDRIEPYGDGRKYQVIFSDPAIEIKNIPYADAPTGSMQGIRYTTFEKLKKAIKVMDLF